jgi:hypothetical protein
LLLIVSILGPFFSADEVVMVIEDAAQKLRICGIMDSSDYT